jgi:hypothetical protein
MGTGNAEMAAEEVANHGLSTSQGIHTRPLAIGSQGLTFRILRETGHHGDGRGSLRHQVFASAQQGIGAFEQAPTRPAGSLAQAHPKGLISGNDRANLQSQSGPTAIGHLEMALP